MILIQCGSTHRVQVFEQVEIPHIEKSILLGFSFNIFASSTDAGCPFLATFTFRLDSATAPKSTSLPEKPQTNNIICHLFPIMPLELA